MLWVRMLLLACVCVQVCLRAYSIQAKYAASTTSASNGAGVDAGAGVCVKDAAAGPVASHTHTHENGNVYFERMFANTIRVCPLKKGQAGQSVCREWC